MTYFGKSNLISFGDPKPEKVIKTKKPLSKIKKPTGEAALFQEIWNERPHKSQISGVKITDPKPINFLHVIPKGQNKYPKYKLEKQNIIIGTAEEHDQWDKGLREKIRHDKKWYWVFELETTLKEKYKIEHG